MKRGLGIKNLDDNLQTGRGQCQNQLAVPCGEQLNLELDTGLINCNGQTGNTLSLEAEIPDHRQTDEFPKNIHAFKTWPNMAAKGGSPNIMMHFMPAHSNDKVSLELILCIPYHI